MLSNIFGGVLALLYMIFKTTVDGIIYAYMPPVTPMHMMASLSDQLGPGEPEPEPEPENTTLMEDTGGGSW